MKQFQQTFPKATTWLALNKSLLAQMMYGSVNEITTKVPTAATNYKQRFFNEEFLKPLTHPEQAGIMAHEIFHEILFHQPRRGNRDPKLWNIAADIKINNLLLQSGFSLPSGALVSFKGERFHGMTEEAIYEALKQEQDKQPDGGGNGEGEPAEGEGGLNAGGNINVVPRNYEGDIPEGEMDKETEAQTKGRVEVAVEMHGIGSLPKEMQEAIMEAMHPKEKWHEHLRRYFTSKQFSGCDWASVSRREYARSGLIAPPFQSDSLGVVVVSVDQSGSMSDEDQAYIAGHLNGILEDCRPERVVVQYFDTKVHEVDEFTVNDLPLAFRRVCSGGTSFVDACEKAEGYEASVHLIFTDGMGAMPDSSSVSTIWGATMEGFNAPFGEVIHIEMGA